MPPYKRRAFSGTIRLMRVAAITFLVLAAALGAAGIVTLGRTSGGFSIPALTQPRRPTPPGAPTEPRTSTLLIVGVPGAGNPAPDLTDTILLARLTSRPPAPAQLRLVSVPRDLAVVGPSGTLQRINSISSAVQTARDEWPGLTALSTTVERVTGITPEHALRVDLSVFRDVVDLLGGLNVAIPEPIVDPHYPTAGGGTETFRIEAGWRYLDAPAAEKYVRTRFGGRGDFDRVRRQQLVVEAIHKKITALSPLTDLSTVLKLLSIVKRRTATTLTLDEMRSLLEESRGLTTANVFVLELASDPVGLLRATNIGGAQVLVPRRGETDYTDIHERIRSFLPENVRRE